MEAVLVIYIIGLVICGIWALILTVEEAGTYLHFRERLIAMDAGVQSSHARLVLKEISLFWVYALLWPLAGAFLMFKPLLIIAKDSLGGK